MAGAAQLSFSAPPGRDKAGELLPTRERDRAPRIARRWLATASCSSSVSSSILHAISDTISSLALLSNDLLLPIDDIEGRCMEYDLPRTTLAARVIFKNFEQHLMPPMVKIRPSTPATTPSAVHSDSVRPSHSSSFTQAVRSALGSEPSWHLPHWPLVPAESGAHGWHSPLEPVGRIPSGQTVQTPSAPPNSFDSQRRHSPSSQGSTLP